MTKVQIMSDLHLEMHRDKGNEFVEKLPVKAPILVLAGDVTMGCYYSNFRNIFSVLAKKFERILYVPGNHEYYNSDHIEVTENLVLLQKEFPTVSVIDKNSVVIDGQRFIGGTMWFAQRKEDEPFKHYMNDFYSITDFEPWVYEENAKLTTYLYDNLKPDDIVVTHHLPAPESIGPQFKGSPLNGFFLHDCKKFIQTVQPRLWIHGHTHVRCDYQIGKTRVVANPHGYPSEGESLMRFDEEFIVEV